MVHKTLDSRIAIGNLFLCFQRIFSWNFQKCNSNSYDISNQQKLQNKITISTSISCKGPPGYLFWMSNDRFIVILYSQEYRDMQEIINIWNIILIVDSLWTIGGSDTANFSQSLSYLRLVSKNFIIQHYSCLPKLRAWRIFCSTYLQKIGRSKMYRIAYTKW